MTTGLPRYVACCWVGAFAFLSFVPTYYLPQFGVFELGSVKISVSKYSELLLSGLIAIVALAFNMLIVLGGLAGFGATLTLPGIAGLVLTIGMAVDANVLIFERIREELRRNKGSGITVWLAIENGYSRSFWTILDMFDL